MTYDRREPLLSNPPNSFSSSLRTGFTARFGHRPRLYLCAGLALAIYFIEPSDFGPALRALIAWNIAALTFLVFVFRMMARCDADKIRRRADREDENRYVLLAIGVLAAGAALAAIFAELGPVKSLAGWAKGEHLALVAATILSAWSFIHVLFALHYAHEYYGERAPWGASQGRAGLRFPDELHAPIYADFLYYSFVIGCACATADIETISPMMRRTTLLHGVVAFFFNTVILALTINIGAGLF